MTKLTPQESARSARIVKRKQKQIIKTDEELRASRRKHLEEMRDLYFDGLINFERDDRRVYRQYSETEIDFILGEISDEEYDDLKQNEEFYEEKL